MDGNRKRRDRTRLRWVIGSVTAAAVLAAAWIIYDGWYRIPRGPSLPLESADRNFADNVVSLNNRAGEIQQYDPETTLGLYDEALSLDAAYHVAYANKAQLLMLHQDYDKAAACFERATALRPNAAEYYVGHAYCLQRLGKTGEAHDRLLFALSAYNGRVEESPFWARLNRALVLFLLGRERVAGRELERLHDRYTDDASRQMVTFLQESFETAQDGDLWSFLGFP